MFTSRHFIHSLLLLTPAVGTASSQNGFDPFQFQKQSVDCPAVDRSSNPPQDVNLNLAYLDINPEAKKALILAHGWPSLWTTYRHQITRFSQDYRLIIPEHRGFGDSEHPRDLNSSNTMYDVSFSQKEVSRIRVEVQDELKGRKFCPILGHNFWLIMASPLARERHTMHDGPCWSRVRCVRR